LHCAIGASTESGELLDAFKKHIYYKKELDIINVGEEIADIQWYLFNLCRLLNLDMEKLLENNIDKLRKRYGDKFSSDKAINRDVEAERKVLEGGIVIEIKENLIAEQKKETKWNSLAKDIQIERSEEEELKNEMRKKLGSNAGVQTSELLTLSDASAVFGYLEDYQSDDYTVKVIDSDESIDKLKKMFSIDLFSYKKELDKLRMIALLFNDVTDIFSFVLLLSFDEKTGRIKYHSAIGKHGALLESGFKDAINADNFIHQYNIQK
jgi:hypothetical protein